MLWRIDWKQHIDRMSSVKFPKISYWNTNEEENGLILFCSMCNRSQEPYDHYTLSCLYPRYFCRNMFISTVSDYHGKLITMNSKGHVWEMCTTCSLQASVQYVCQVSALKFPWFGSSSIKKQSHKYFLSFIWCIHNQDNKVHY